MWQELQRDVHKRQLLIDEELKQSVDCIRTSTASGAGYITDWLQPVDL